MASAGLDCPKCGKNTRVTYTMNMGVVIWRTRGCSDLKCNYIFISKEVREDLETLANQIVTAIASWERIANRPVDAANQASWINLVKGVLQKYKDQS